MQIKIVAGSMEGTVMNKYIKALVKVTSQYEYAQNFRDGKLWMNELRFFTKCEQKELGDAKEARGITFSFLNQAAAV